MPISPHVRVDDVTYKDKQCLGMQMCSETLQHSIAFVWISSKSYFQKFYWKFSFMTRTSLAMTRNDFTDLLSLNAMKKRADCGCSMFSQDTSANSLGQTKHYNWLYITLSESLGVRRTQTERIKSTPWPSIQLLAYIYSASGCAELISCLINVFASICFWLILFRSWRFECLKCLCDIKPN